MILPRTVCVTLWSGRGLRAAWAARETRALLDAARPPTVQLHAAPAELLVSAAAITRELRAALPSARVWWAIAGDAGAANRVAGLWTGVAKAATESGVDALVLNCEGAWKTRPAGLATAAIAAVRAAAPGLALGHTAYDQPPLHGRYPWREFLGSSGCDFSLPQVYWAPEDGGDARPGAGPARLAAHRHAWAATVAAGRIRADCATGAYLQAHGCTTADLCGVADTFDTVAFWAVPTRLDVAGARAIRALCELARRRQRVREFQRTAGLAVDGLVGPRTLAALGVT